MDVDEYIQCESCDSEFKVSHFGDMKVEFCPLCGQNFEDDDYKEEFVDDDEWDDRYEDDDD